jgi:hypothetical protein
VGGISQKVNKRLIFELPTQKNKSRNHTKTLSPGIAEFFDFLKT